MFLLFEQLDGETQFDAFPEGALKEFVQRKSTFSRLLVRRLAQLFQPKLTPRVVSCDG